MLAPLFTCCLLILSSHSVLGEELWGGAYLCTYLKSYMVENQHQRESQQQRDHSLFSNTILGFKIRSKVKLEEDEDDVVMPTPRLLGRDKQKDEKKKGKDVEGYLNQSGKFLFELVQQENEAREDMR
ncbi:unnamed protein product [Prunus brigantina]